MVIATPEFYADILDHTEAGKYAIPAINVTSSQTLSATLQGFAEAESDGIVQVSNRGAAYWSGSSCANRIEGLLTIFAHAYSVADLYPVTSALHTDHCPRKLVGTWLRPLLETEIEQTKCDEPTTFQSYMWDGPAETLGSSTKLAAKLLTMSKKTNITLEIEIGAVGGEEGDIKGKGNANLYTTADNAWAAVETLGLGENGRCTTTSTFSSMHGTYKPGHAKLRSELLGEIQADIVERLGNRLATKVGDKKTPFNLAMRSGSGSTVEETAMAVRSGVIKMSADTDTQYAFTRPVADHAPKSYDGMLKISGEVGSKKVCDPHVWGKVTKKGMATRVIEACERLGSVDSAHKWVLTSYGVERRLTAARGSGTLVVPGPCPVCAGGGGVGGKASDGELIDRLHSYKGG